MEIKPIQVKTILPKSNLPVAGYSINPYIGYTHACKYCYACFMKRFTGHQEERGDFLDVKYWDKIKNPHKYSGQTMIIGSVTDAYNPEEEEYKRTRAFLEEMQESGVKIMILTKSDLVLRDLDLIKTFPDIIVSWSINTLDKKVAEYAKDNGFMYVIDKEPFVLEPSDKPIIINYFYHSEIKQSAKGKR